MHLEPSNADINNKFDVIILGAGPSGCAAALTMSKLGLCVGVIDPQRKSNFKVGESVPSSISKLLNRIGIKDFSSLLNRKDYEPCAINKSAWGTETWSYRDSILDPYGNGWQLNRQAFEVALLKEVKKKKVVVIKGKAVSITHKNGYIINVKTSVNTKAKAVKSLHCNWIVDASGRSAITSRPERAQRIKLSNQMAAIAWVKATRYVLKATVVKSVANGWWYVANQPGPLLVIAFFGLAKDVSFYKKHKYEFIDAFNRSKTLDLKLHPDHIVHDILVRDASVSRLNRFFINEILFVGDAAITLDPLSSQGIYFSLYSGIKAGEAIARSSGNATRHAEYLNAFASKIEHVFTKNQEMRKFLYQNELRFSASDYWIDQQKMLKVPWKY